MQGSIVRPGKGEPGSHGIGEANVRACSQDARVGAKVKTWLLGGNDFSHGTQQFCRGFSLPPHPHHLLRTPLHPTVLECRHTYTRHLKKNLSPNELTMTKLQPQFHNRVPRIQNSKTFFTTRTPDCVSSIAIIFGQAHVCNVADLWDVTSRSWKNPAEKWAQIHGLREEDLSISKNLFEAIALFQNYSWMAAVSPGCWRWVNDSAPLKSFKTLNIQVYNSGGPTTLHPAKPNAPD